MVGGVGPEPGAGVPEGGVNNAPDANGMAPTGVSKKKGNKGMLIGMIILAILAAGGIGFGTWAWMTGFSKGMKNEEEIMTLRAELKSAQEALDNTTAAEEDVEVDAEVGGNENVDTADYIYVGEWGLKIKKPKDLGIVNYSFSGGDTYGDYLNLSGAKEKIDGAIPKFANLDMYVGSIVKSSSDDGFYPYGELVYTDSAGGKYYYEGANGVPNLSTDEIPLWEEVKSIVKNTLTSPDNFSEI